MRYREKCAVTGKPIDGEPRRFDIGPVGYGPEVRAIYERAHKAALEVLGEQAKKPNAAGRIRRKTLQVLEQFRENNGAGLADIIDGEISEVEGKDLSNLFNSVDARIAKLKEIIKLQTEKLFWLEANK